MYLHIDLAARRIVPWLPEARKRVDAAAHARLARPDWAGRRIAMSGSPQGIEKLGE
jgi:hypothetical protein